MYLWRKYRILPFTFRDFQVKVRKIFTRKAEILKYYQLCSVNYTMKSEFKVTLVTAN